MYISKSRFINWTRCPMYFAMDLKHNPQKKTDIDIERERREEMFAELLDGPVSSEGEGEEEFDAKTSEELEALLPYYNQVEDEALKVAKHYFSGKFIADCRDVHNQKLFEYEHNGHIYRCYVDIYNETEEEINIIEVKATTFSKFAEMNFSAGRNSGIKYPLFVKDGNVYSFNISESLLSDAAKKNFDAKKAKLLNRYSEEGKYPHDIAFQRFVIENALRMDGDNRRVNYYLAVLNSDYVYDGAKDTESKNVYGEVDGQEIITFIDMNETSKAYQPIILKEIASLESYISSPHDTGSKVDVGHWCAWGKNTECVFWKHCFQKLRNVPDSNSSNKYLNSGNTVWDGKYKGKYELVNAGLYSMADIDRNWIAKNDNHKIQRDCYDGVIPEYVDKEKMQAWFGHLEYPIYHFDFESFPCPLPRFKGEHPYQQSCFEFSLHIERSAGVCGKDTDNFIFLNEECDTDEREALAKAIVDNFEFNEDGSLHGTMLAQFSNFEIDRLTELSELFPEYKDKLLAITKKSADLIHLLRTKSELYEAEFGKKAAETINYYHPDLSGSYSIKKTLPVLVPSLSYDDMKKHTVGNGVQAYITYLNYDAKPGATRDMNTKLERREALRRYCQQDTWAMVEILRAVRAKI